MAEFPKLTMTNKAIEMIAESQLAGNDLIITKVKIGDGQLADGADIKAMTDVVAARLVAPMTDSKLDGGQVTVNFTISNSELEAGFFAREIGIFAKLGEAGAETLYAYTNAGNLCDWIPDKHTPIDSQIVNATIVVGNASNVVVNVSDKAFVTTKDLESHNTAADAHADIRNKIQTVQQNASLFMLPVKRNNTYAVGDCASATGLPSWAYLECVTAGTTDESEPDFSGVTSGDKVTYGTTVFIIRKIGSLSGFNIGDIKWSSADLTQAGFLIANGAEVGRATYPDLCAVYEAMGFPWGAGDGSTTFNLPNLIGKFAEGADSAGGYHKAGLPNIKGSFLVDDSAIDGTIEGACYVKSGGYVGGVNAGGGAGYNATQIGIDASKSNSIYGNSTTVQPPSALLIPYVKAFNGASADSTDLAITEVANDVARISERVYLVESAVNSDGSWYRKYSDGWLEQGGILAQSSQTEVVNLIKPYADINYTVHITSWGPTGGSSDGYNYISALTTTTFTAEVYLKSQSFSKGRWSACGQGAE